MSDLIFNAEDHSYWLDDRRLPGVTETISRLAPYPWPIDDWYLQRGSAVHAAVSLSLQGNLDPESVDDRIRGRFNAVLAFLHDTGLDPLLIETPLASRRYQFAGTIDYYGANKKGELILADWKGSLSPQVELQMGAYALLLGESESRYRTDRAAAVETHDDGTYKCRWLTRCELQLASQKFLAFLTVRNWLDANKFAPKNQ